MTVSNRANGGARRDLWQAGGLDDNLDRGRDGCIDAAGRYWSTLVHSSRHLRGIIRGDRPVGQIFPAKRLPRPPSAVGAEIADDAQSQGRHLAQTRHHCRSKPPGPDERNPDLASAPHAFVDGFEQEWMHGFCPRRDRGWVSSDYGDVHDERQSVAERARPIRSRFATMNHLAWSDCRPNKAKRSGSTRSEEGADGHQ